MMPVRGARTRALVEFAERRVSLAFGVRLLSEAPVDLFRLAATRRIHSVEFRPLLADGCLIATADGCCVQINARERAVVDVGAVRESRTLSAKQRFTLAHEIAHTLTYDIEHTPPNERREVIEVIDLIDAAGGRAGSQNVEDFCQIVGGKIETGRNRRTQIELGP
jgi:hypothetical protein